MSIVEETLKKYLEKHGARILSIATISGQKEILIEVRALYRYFIPSEKYSKLQEAIKFEKEKICEKGIKVIEKNGTCYIKLSISKIRELLSDDEVC